MSLRRTVTGALVSCLLALPLAAADPGGIDDAPPSDPAAAPTWALDELIDELDPLCAPILAAWSEARGQADDDVGQNPMKPAVDDVIPDAAPSPYDSDTEHDPVAPGACRTLRDEAETYTWSVAPEPVVPETCQTVRGVRSCVAVNHWQCDVAFVTYYNQVFLCLGGLFPDN